MSQDIFNNDVHVRGALSCRSLIVPAGSVGDAEIEANAGIGTSKTIHRHIHRYNQVPGSAIVAATVDLHIARADGLAIALEAAITGTIATGADRTVEIDLLKSTGGGSFASILTDTIVFDDDDTVRIVKAAVVDDTGGDFVEGDLLRLTIAVAGAAGNQADGLVVNLTLDEDPQ